LYLAASGVGHIGIVDFDDVEISNLHRQVIHSTDRCGWNKAVSACYTLNRLNPTIQCRAYPIELDHDNVMELVQQYDVVVDCSDNPRTRYLINDACVLANKPLVSGSSVGVEGQLTVYNHEDGPCYRCLYPQPSATSQVCNRACSDAGVFGPVPGLIGILQATETIKIITNNGNTMKNRLLMYDALQSTFFTIKKPPKMTTSTSTSSNCCPVCGPEPTICSMRDSYESLSLATGPRRNPTLIPPPIDDELNMTCLEYNAIRQQGTPHVLLDVRVKEQFDLCHLDGAIHIPLDDLPNELHRVESLLFSSPDGMTAKPIYCICRRGINSIAATKILHEHFIKTVASITKSPSNGSSKNMNGDRIFSVRNIAGGLTSWQKEIDPGFPKY
jgi:adenylyltransferase and sulfurtransferase